MNACHHPPSEHHRPSPVRVIGRNFVDSPPADECRSRRDRGNGDDVVDLVLDQARYFFVFRCLPASTLRQLFDSVKVFGTTLGYFSPAELLCSCELVVASRRLPPRTFLSLSRTNKTCGAAYHEANICCRQAGATPDGVDVRPSDPDRGGAATPETNRSV